MARAGKTTAPTSAKGPVAKRHASSARHEHSSAKTRGNPKKAHTNGHSSHSAVRLTPATNTEAPAFIVRGNNDNALFTLTAYRGEGMCLLAMNWKTGTPTNDFVGFAIEYQVPKGTQFYTVENRIKFPDAAGHSGPNALSSRLAPLQKFRWIHFPYQADIPGNYTYRVTPVFMNGQYILSYGDFQEVDIELEAETYPGELNICFTRGFVASQAFVDKFGTKGGVGTILPKSANSSIDFKPSDPNGEVALAWMGFEARKVILEALDAAIADKTAQVRVAAYDFNEPAIVSRLQQLRGRLKIIIDDSGSHKHANSSESTAADMLAQSIGSESVQRQHMGGLQHNKVLVVSGDHVKLAIGGSTNFSWRGLYVQNNNAAVVQGAKAVEIFTQAFDNLWGNQNNPANFNHTSSAEWTDLGFSFNAQISFSPHNSSNAALQGIADDIEKTESSLFYSLAFLYETHGVVHDAIQDVTAKDDIFVYGLSDKTVGGLNLQLPNGNPPVVFPGALLKKVPPPFEAEATGGSGTRLHHKFVVIDFNKPTARVYTGSHNFSIAADTKNGENLFLIQDQRVATSYMIQALTMFDHYQFRDLEASSKQAARPIELKTPPAQGSGDKAWWDKYWTDARHKRDRELFGI
jgi:hypothetical protein